MSKITLDIAIRLDAESASHFKEEVLKQLALKVDTIFLDFSKTEFIDSIGLGTLVSILKLMKKSNKELVLLSLSIPIQEIFELTKLNTIFNVYNDKNGLI